MQHVEQKSTSFGHPWEPQGQFLKPFWHRLGLQGDPRCSQDGPTRPKKELQDLPKPTPKRSWHGKAEPLKNIEKPMVFIGFCIFLKTPRPVDLVKQWNGKHIDKSKSIKFKLTANRNKVQTWLKKYILKDKYNTPEFQQIRSQVFAIHRIHWPAQSFLALFAVYTSHPALMLASVNPSLRSYFTSHGHLDAILAPSWP